MLAVLLAFVAQSAAAGDPHISIYDSRLNPRNVILEVCFDLPDGRLDCHQVETTLDDLASGYAEEFLDTAISNQDK